MGVSERVELRFHETIWGAANAYSDVERACSDARGLAYAALDDNVDQDLLRRIANDWLDRFGRDALREARR